MKWIAIAALVAIGVLVVLLLQVFDEPDAPRGFDAVPVAVPRPPDAAPVAAAPADAAPPAADAGPQVFAVKSEEFWDRVDEYPRHRMLSYVADCYKGGKHRKAKLKLTYELVVQNHQVTFRNIQIVDTTMGDEVLEQCMVRALEEAQFEDLQMPDYRTPTNDPEQILIRIENLKRFYPEQDDGMK
jgi:hypothetical protein